MNKTKQIIQNYGIRKTVIPKRKEIMELADMMDQKLFNGKITDLKINEKRLSKKQIKKLNEEDTNN